MGYTIRSLAISIVVIFVVLAQRTEAGESPEPNSATSGLLSIFSGEKVGASIRDIKKDVPLKVENWKVKDAVLCVTAEITMGTGNPKYREALTYATELEFIDIQTLGGYPTFLASPTGGFMFDFDKGTYSHSFTVNPIKGSAAIVISTGINAQFDVRGAGAKDINEPIRESRVDIDLTRFLDWPTPPETVICIGTGQRKQIIAEGKHEGRRRWSWLLVNKDLRFPIYQAGAHEEGSKDEPTIEFLLNISVRDRSTSGPIPGLSRDLLDSLGIKSEKLPQELKGKRLNPYDESVITDTHKFAGLVRACNQAPMLRLMNFCGIEMPSASTKSSAEK